MLILCLLQNLLHSEGAASSSSVFWGLDTKSKETAYLSGCRSLLKSSQPLRLRVVTLPEP